MIGETSTPSGDVLYLHSPSDRYSTTFVTALYSTHCYLFAIDHISIPLDLDVSLGGDDVGLDDSLVVGHGISWKMFWWWNVFWRNREAQQRSEDRLGSHFRTDYVSFPAERVQDA